MDEIVPPVTETEGIRGTLFDPDWAEVRGVFKGLWFWSDELVAYYQEQLKWREEIEAQIIAKMDPLHRKALGWE